eukprot:TRINITY_DN7687_c0_g1_i1.p1 TRINITY_DN7687_c0_g1~~TRINITY_DN7687_c0_g1_i1.p1  ORF type:complete len:1093 (+),score=298.96 TRINITY_DN7687_c0_g1_i1:83-3361(+)
MAEEDSKSAPPVEEEAEEVGAPEGEEQPEEGDAEERADADQEGEGGAGEDEPMDDAPADEEPKEDAEAGDEEDGGDDKKPEQEDGDDDKKAEDDEADAGMDEGDWSRQEDVPGSYWQNDEEQQEDQQQEGEKQDEDGAKKDEDEPEDGAKKDEPEEVKPYVECEEDAPADDRPKVAAGAFAATKAESTLNVMMGSEGKLLMALSDGGFQHLAAGLRSTAGLKGGRYLFEVRVVEMKFTADSAARGQKGQERQFVSLGFSTAGSSLFLGQDAESVAYASDGSFYKDGKSSWFGNDRVRLQQQMVLAVVLNLDKESPNANTVSFFVDGVRLGKPESLPENLVDKVLYPTMNYKGVTLQPNFAGPLPFAPLPFACRTLQDAAQADCEVLAPKQGAPAEGDKCEVLFPIGLPDEGTFGWLDGFLKEKPWYQELSRRALVDWGLKSGLHRRSGTRLSCNDYPSMDFGIKPLDDGDARKLLRSIAPVAPRNFVVMEVQKNLLPDERRKSLANFDPADFKRIAVVVMGEPPADFKAKVQEELLAEKKQKAGAAAAKAAKKRWSEEGEEKKELTEEEIEEQVKKAEEAVELTPQEKEVCFKKPEVQDLDPRDLAKSFGSFALPTQDEGFDEIRYIWQGESECAEYLKKWLAEKKLTQRVEDLKPGEWFKAESEKWHRTLSVWRRRCDDWKKPQRPRDDDNKRRRLEEQSKAKTPGAAGSEAADNEDKDKDKEAAEEDATNGSTPASVEEVDIWHVKDMMDVINGEPLFSKFSWEDWMLLSLRAELHLLVHAYKRDINDPERVSFHESHTQFYYDLYFKKQLQLKNYGVNSVTELMEIVKDTTEVVPKNSMLDPQLSDDTPLENFLKLTEDHRRARLRKLDAGDESGTLRLIKPHQQQHQRGGNQGGYRSHQKGDGRGGNYSQSSRAPPGGAGALNRGGGDRRTGPAGAGARGGSGAGYAGRTGGSGQGPRHNPPPAPPPARGSGSMYGGRSGGSGPGRHTPPPAPPPRAGGSTSYGGGAKRSYDDRGDRDRRHGSGGASGGHRGDGGRDYKSQRTSYNAPASSGGKGGGKRDYHQGGGSGYKGGGHRGNDARGGGGYNRR